MDEVASQGQDVNNGWEEAGIRRGISLKLVQRLRSRADGAGRACSSRIIARLARDLAPFRESVIPGDLRSGLQ
jgi:hypothetical protein